MSVPELPEVETTARGLNKLVKGRRIKDVWTDWPKYFRFHKNAAVFKKCVAGRKILGVRRVGKNVIFDLSGDYLLVVHQKMSGHLLVGTWKKQHGKWRGDEDGLKEQWENQKWVPGASKNSPFWDPKNRFIRLIFFLDRGEMLALSDLRRFAKALCGPKEEIFGLPDFENLGPDPTAKNFTFKKFKKLFENKKGRIKQVLLDQTFIAGIGNIYSDEILWKAKVYPLAWVQDLGEKKLRVLYKTTREILNKALKLQGTSIDDYRKPKGRKGGYAEVRYVYQREGEKCKRCSAKIKRIKVGGRSAHFCPHCQRQ